MIISLPINLTCVFGCSKEPSHLGGSFEYPQHMFWMRHKKSFSIRTLIWRPDNNNNNNNKMSFRNLNWISLIQ